MSKHDRFLKSRTHLHGAPLGRVFGVVQETWRVDDDPRKVKPDQTELASRRTASDAADLAREAALAYEQHGFHKASGAWWGSDGEHFHRFLVAAAKKRHGGLILGLGVAALGAVAVGAAMQTGGKAAKPAKLAKAR
jgi:hypothetical protein